MSSIEDLPTVGDVAATRHQMGLWSCMSYVIGEKSIFEKKNFLGEKNSEKKIFEHFFFSKNFFRSNIQNLKHFPVSANIIGAGIFITPGTVLKLALTNGMALVVWLGCGLISLIGGICYIELGTSIRDPGCDFAYNVSGEFGKFAQKRGKIDFS